MMVYMQKLALIQNGTGALKYIQVHYACNEIKLSFSHILDNKFSGNTWIHQYTLYL